MKKNLFIIALAVIFLAGCSGASKKESSELKALEKEITTTDSIAAEMDKTIDEIQESEAQLDLILNEL